MTFEKSNMQIDQSLRQVLWQTACIKKIFQNKLVT